MEPGSRISIERLDITSGFRQNWKILDLVLPANDCVQGVCSGVNEILIFGGTTNPLMKTKLLHDESDLIIRMDDMVS